MTFFFRNSLLQILDTEACLCNKSNIILWGRLYHSNKCLWWRWWLSMLTMFDRFIIPQVGLIMQKKAHVAIFMLTTIEFCKISVYFLQLYNCPEYITLYKHSINEQPLVIGQITKMHKITMSFCFVFFLTKNNNIELLHFTACSKNFLKLLRMFVLLYYL